MSSGADPGSEQPEGRERELETRLGAVRERISRACEDAGRQPGDVHLIVVTKTWPAEDVRRLALLGVTDVGENRHQEAAPKREAVEDLPLTWHFIGQLQTNKARAVVAYADVIHSVDRVRLVTALDRAAGEEGRHPRCLVQVDLDPASEQRRGGAEPGDVAAVAEAVAASSRLRLGGLMAVAPRHCDPAAAFARLYELAERLRADHPSATMISAGMSGDLEAAVAAGATHLRVGTAILGSRPPLG